MKGLEKLINGLIDVCPSNHDLDDVNRIDTFEGCMYGDGGRLDVCKDCWKQALEKEY